MKWLCLIPLACLPPGISLAQAPRADLCVELSNFMAKQETSTSQPPKEAATAVQAPAKGARPTPGGSNQPQQSSGISGPVTHGGPGAAGPQAGAQESAKTGEPNPKPQAAAPPPKDVAAPAPGQASADALQAARDASGQKDVLNCRKAAQDLRRAGLDLPADLLALSALDPKILSPVQEK